MTGEKAAVLIMDDTSQKAFVVLSIMITSLLIISAFGVFFHIKDYQYERSEEFEADVQMEQLDYLIGLIDHKERMPPPRPGGQYGLLQARVGRFMETHAEFADQLEDLHQMLGGMARKEKSMEDAMMKGKRK